MPFRLVNSYRRFGEAYCLHIQGRAMHAECEYVAGLHCADRSVYWDYRKEHRMYNRLGKPD